MGGTGSGRRFIKKALVEEACSLAVRDLLPIIRAGTGYVGMLRLITRYGSERQVSVQIMGDQLHPLGVRLAYVLRGQSIDHQVRLETTLMPSGAQRWWFTCDCGRRAGKLYLPWDEVYFACWRCHRLTWESNQTEHSFDTVCRYYAARCGVTADEFERVFEEGTLQQLHDLLGQ